MATMRGSHTFSDAGKALEHFLRVLGDDREASDVTISYLHIARREGGQFLLDYEYQFQPKELQ